MAALAQRCSRLMAAFLLLYRKPHRFVDSEIYQWLDAAW